MINFENQKGSITLTVLISCMFFLASVVCVQMYAQSKQNAVNNEYKQIKANYEVDVKNADTIYSELLAMQSMVTFDLPEFDSVNTLVKVPCSIDTSIDRIKSLKYGWIYSDSTLVDPSVDDVNDWNFTEINEEIVAIHKYSYSSGYYYLCVMVNNIPFWKEVQIAL